ncbi:Bug family tripartite tricarboxylate transporter substrate binding protein [Falsiroseomonas oryzae]|uniref:Bug family tripartite tricarboxylate transporter substrate binding protein n=1 Tax=Falsiroseomonas oryzae TaxID=2766473 RepID=UPI0022EB0A46|nr:tripartite tricarboxylate transporter substrate binding protein [Roseomonas sp. MO-31]
MIRANRRALLAAATAALAAPAGAQAPWAPSRPIRMMVGFPPGGAADILARRLAEGIAPALGQPVVVENRPGAGAQIAVDAVAKAPADGSVIGLCPVGPLAVNPVLTPARVPYDAANDFTVLVQAWDQPNVLVGAMDVPQAWPDFVAWLRARPDEPFASVGPGTSNHLVGELLARALNVRMQHVPYRGSPAALTDIMSGRLKLFVDNVITTIPLAREGKVRALAVTTQRRVDALPEVPTMAELGLPDVTVSSWQVVIGPRGLPAPIVARLNAELDRAIRAPEMVAWMASIGAQPVGGSAADASAMVARERERWARVIPTLGISVD